jgi:hypothetical protein
MIPERLTSPKCLGKKTETPWWLTVEVKSLPREEMFEILDSGRTGSASCLSGDDTSEWLVAVDGGEI